MCAKTCANAAKRTKALFVRICRKHRLARLKPAVMFRIAPVRRRRADRLGNVRCWVFVINAKCALRAKNATVPTAKFQTVKVNASFATTAMLANGISIARLPGRRLRLAKR